MPITHRIDREAGIIFVERSGTIESQDEDEALRRRLSDPDYRPGLGMLVDCTGMDPADSTEVICYLADQTAHMAARLRCGPLAILVKTDVQYGMARMYQLMTDHLHRDTLVFRDREQALAWLQGELDEGG